MPEDIDIFTDCGLSSKVTLWKGVTSGIFLSKMIHGLWVAIPGILSVSSQNFKMAAEVLHVLICKCSRQEEMEGVLISCRVFSYYGEKSFAKHLHQISTYEDLTGKGGLLSSCNAWAFHCSGFSSCRAQALGLWAQ